MGSERLQLSTHQSKKHMLLTALAVNVPPAVQEAIPLLTFFGCLSCFIILLLCLA